jgi:hypothetical protein
MLNKMLLIITMFVLMIYCAEKKEDCANIIAPSYDKFIGKKIVQIEEVDSMLSSFESGALYENREYGLTIYGNSHYLDKYRTARFIYIFFTKKVGYKGAFPIDKILDIVPVDMNKFSGSATIWLDECDCKNLKSCNTIAIYHHDQTMAEKDIMVKPLKVWRPNIATGKLEEISPDSVRCGSQAPEEE